MERFHFKIMICNKWQNNTQKKKKYYHIFVVQNYY